MDRSEVRFHSAPLNRDTVPAAGHQLSAPTRHQALRSATAAAHAEVDQIVRNAGYFETTEKYGSYIQRMHAFQQAFDAAATGAGEGLLNAWKILDRAGWLAEDVASLGLKQNSVARPAGITRLKLQTKSECLGAGYVLMGAGLGSRILIVRARELQLPGDAGVTYLSGLSETVNWQDFLRFLEAAPGINIDELISGANATFSFIAHCLSECVAA